jgi:hypothetical protein
MFHLMDSDKSGSHVNIQSLTVSHSGRETSGQVSSQTSGLFVREGRTSIEKIENGRPV